MALRYILRGLGRNPGFTAVAILSLAFGIGANTAIFTLVNALLLRELPVRQPERLVQLSAQRREGKTPFSYPMFRELERGQRVFSGLIGWSYGFTSNVEVNGVPSRAFVDSVSGNYYSELGVVPLLGRLIAPTDVKTSGGAADPVAVLGYELWQRRFGGAPDVVGKKIRVENQVYTIIGVTRKWFTGITTGRAPEVTVPIKATDNRSLLWVFITGRLKDDVTIGRARAQLESIWPAVLLATASTDTPGLRRQAFLSMGLDVVPVATGVARELRSQFTRPLYVLLGIVGLILMVACVNLANLMLAGSAAHSYEVSVRMALGAGRWALARQALTESLALSASGALLGLALGYWGSGLLIRLMTRGFLTPVTLDVRPDWRVLSFTSAMALLTGILFGVAPAWRASRQDPASVLQRNARGLAGAIGKAGKALMITQVALSLVLLLGAGLLVRSFQNLCGVETGFEQRVVEVSPYPRPGGYKNLDMNNYRRQLMHRISEMPGVISAGFSDYSGPGQKGWQGAVSTMTAASNPNAEVMATALMISPGFLRTLGIRVLLGRDFDWMDDERRPGAAIISSHLAARLFPSGNAIGQRIRFGVMPELQNLEIVGVATTARLFDLRDASAPMIYLPDSQHPTSAGRGDIFLRARTAPDAIARAVGREIESFGHEYVFGVRTIGDAVNQALTTDRLVALLSGFFAILALLLASIGLYGLTSYTVARRTREIGIRTALGAQPSAVRWHVLRGALMLTLAGIALGIPFAFGAGRLIAGMLFGITSGDWPATAGVALLLLVVALLAGYGPARRASHIDPAITLRLE